MTDTERALAELVPLPWSRKRKPQPSHRLTIWQLKDNSCRWPIGTALPYHFCGEPKAPGSSYCPVHRRMAYKRH